MESEGSVVPSTSSNQNFSHQASNMGHGMHGMWHPYSLPPPQLHPYANRYHQQHYPHYFSHKQNMGQHQMQQQQQQLSPQQQHLSPQHQLQVSQAAAVSRPVMSTSTIMTSSSSVPLGLQPSSLGSGAILRQAIQQSSGGNHLLHQSSQEMQASGPVLQQVLTHGAGAPVQSVPGISVALSPQTVGSPYSHSMPTNLQAYPKNKILTRGRLQELVREVDPNEQLDDDVEELLIQLAEEFVDSAMSGACILAKHRKANSVDVKDLELHLERNWNMWIPGFGTDELRPYKRSFVTEAHKQRLSLIRKNLKKY